MTIRGEWIYEAAAGADIPSDRIVAGSTRGLEDAQHELIQGGPEARCKGLFEKVFHSGQLSPARTAKGVNVASRAREPDGMR